MASMRYIRGEAQGNRKKADPSLSFSAGGNKWESSERIAKKSCEGRGRGRGNVDGSVNRHSPRGRGGGRGRGKILTSAFVRETNGSVKRDLRLTSNLLDIKWAVAGSKKWVRKTDEKLPGIEENGCTVTTTENCGPMEKMLIFPENSVDSSEQLQTTDINESHKKVLEKRGRNKLVLKRESSRDDHSSSPSLPTKQSSGFSESTAAGVDSDPYLFNCTTQTMSGYGHRDVSFKHASKSKANPAKNLTWKRKSSDLLSQSSAGDADTDNRLSQRNKGKPINRKPVGARRILLVRDAPKSDVEESHNTENESLEDKPDAVENETAVDNSAQEAALKQKTLTDFCYRDTGRGRGGRVRGSFRGRGSFHGGRVSGRGSMGLVRVKPENPGTMPICPTFRRGIPCNNPKCALRHDVSSEASRPICVFFQRNGMCSKGDQCPFRHVKVRWDAEICPTFQRLGYCEDPDCVLRHVTTKKSRVDSSAALVPK
ncbi:hypothetical protein ACHAXS_013919 [Conticribra weissflogii]